MKIATFNINNVNSRLPNLLQWLKSSKPDIACLQELKSTDEAFPADALRKAGYGAVWKGQRTWNGVAILARGALPIVTRTSLPGDRDDSQARYIEAAIDGILVGCIYLPNGNPQPGPKFEYKLDWFKRLQAHAHKLVKELTISLIVATRSSSSSTICRSLLRVTGSSIWDPVPETKAAL